MGCCPSKHKADKAKEAEDGEYYPPTEKIDVDFTLSDRSTHATTVLSSRDVAAVHHAPSNILMDRGDGRAMEHSDHESMNDYGVEETKPIDHQIVISIETNEVPPPHGEEKVDKPSIPAIRFDDSMGMQPSPSRPSLSSPSKTPINFEDMPINSMYHRIHTVEVEEMESKRRQELQEEAERREREIQEFKAAMLTPTNG